MYKALDKDREKRYQAAHELAEALNRAQGRRQALFDTGHVPPRNDVIKETLDWYERYLDR